MGEYNELKVNGQSHLYGTLQNLLPYDVWCG